MERIPRAVYTKAIRAGNLATVGANRSPLGKQEAGLSRLRKELAATKMERDLLKKKRPRTYAQCGDSDFVPGLSAIDLLFNHGPESREILACGAQLACY